MILRRYTPPTCTLEIKAKESPLSRWAGQPVLKQLRFELRFDDPRQPEEKRVTIWGDRTELEALHEAVTTYVQDFLKPSPVLLPVGSLESAMPLLESSPTSLVPNGTPAAEENSALLSPQHSGTLTLLNNSFPTVYIQPRGLLTHDLFLGRMETEESGPFVSLSALQLFDLATALDECAAQMVALPQLGRPIWQQTLPPWTKAAAMVMLTVGLTTAAVKLLDRFGNGSQQKAAQAPTPSASPTSPAPAVAQASPVPAPPTATPALPIPPTATPTPPLSPPLLNTPARLSPPSAVPVPPPPRTGSQPLVIPDTSTTPPRGSSQPLVVIPRTGTTLPRSNSSSRLSSVPPPPYSAPPVFTPRTPPSQPSAPSVAAKRQSASRPQPQVAKPQEQPAESPAPVPTPTIAQLPSPPSLSRRSRSKKEDAPRDNLPQLNPSPPVALVPDRSGETANVSPPSSSSPPDLSSSATSQNRSSQQGADRSESPPKGRLFDTVPQVAQIRNYFQQRWKAPEELTQPIEYNLVLNRDGSIDRIIPLGSAAGTYLNRTNMPTPGQPFVSAFDTGNTPTVRLVLYPDGRVETFLAPTK